MSILSTLKTGVCHYPEHWPESMMADDFRRIADAGFDVVRLGESAWGYFEPSEGNYQFDLFDKALDLCRANGLGVIMGTPTYAGPAWIASNYPEVLRWNFNRQPMRHGSRRNYNYTSPKYLDLSDRICTALATHFKDHPSILGWQVDNEFNCHMDVSYAPSDTVAFRKWLEAKYKSIQSLNDAWGTRFWSQQYDSWNQIDLPGPTSAYQNPTALLDEVRFISDCVVNFLKRQASILRAVNHKWEITHNHLFDNINGPDLVKPLDFYSHDHYPLFGDNDWVNSAFYLTCARSLSEPFCIMEHQAGPGGQMNYLLRSFRPGELRRASWQSIAHGTRCLVYFNWRTCPFGSEQHWYGILDQNNLDNRRLAEVKEFNQEVKSMSKLLDCRSVKRVVGILRQFDTEENEQRIDTFVKGGAKEWDRFCRCLIRRHIPVNFVYENSTHDSFENYKVLIAPHLCIVDEQLVKRLTQYVESGGLLILTARSGIKDRNNHIGTTPAPGLLSQLTGAIVEEFSSLIPKIWADQETPLDAEIGGKVCQIHYYAEKLRIIDAATFGQYKSGDSLFADAPCATLRRTGKGATVYVGGYCNDDTINAILDAALPLANVRPPLQVQNSSELEFIDLISHILIINHGHVACELSISNLQLTFGGKMNDDLLHLSSNSIALLKYTD